MALPHAEGRFRMGMRIAFLTIFAVLCIGFVFAVRFGAVLPGRVPVSEAPAERTVGVPLRLRIPSLQIDSTLEDVGLTAQGGMEIPWSAAIPGWFRYGVRPGEQGSAVIAGHLDSVSGRPGIFWQLNQLQRGDTVVIEDDRGVKHTFRVRESEVYDADDAPLQEIFGTMTGKFLNLITCDGVWEDGAQSYSKRLVVFTELIEQSE